MEDQLKIVIDAEDNEVALEQTRFAKDYFRNRGFDANQQQAQLMKGEAGAEWLPIITVAAPVVKELISVLGTWIKSRSENAKAKKSKIKVLVEGKNGKKITLDISSDLEDEEALVRRISDQLL